MPITIHTPVIRGRPLPHVSPLEAVGMCDPDPYTRALFAQTVKQTKQEMADAKAPNPNVGGADEMRKKILAISLFPSIYSPK